MEEGKERGERREGRGERGEERGERREGKGIQLVSCLLHMIN